MEDSWVFLDGDRGRAPKIGGGDCLVFTMEILEIKGASKPKEL